MGPAVATGAPGRRGDLRRHPRYPLATTGTVWALSAAVPPIAAKASDVSLSGMMLHSSAESMGALRVGDELLFGFTDPVSKDQFRLRAVLRWKRRGIMRLLGAWAFGVEFTGTPEEDVRRLLDPAAKASAPLP